MTSPALQRPALEVADVIRQYGDAFLAASGSGLCGVQRQALRDLANCRTAALGGHVERCLDCGHERIAYNSCRNRQRPLVGAAPRRRLLPIPLADGTPGWLCWQQRRETSARKPIAEGCCPRFSSTGVYAACSAPTRSRVR
jgi:hypothetical protein